MPSHPNSLPATLEVVPGVSIGPVKIGMRAEELAALKLPLKTEPQSDSQFRIESAPPLRIVLKDSVVLSVEATLAENSVPVLLFGKLLAASSSLEALATLFPDCGPLERGEGGDSYRCSGGSTLLKRGSGDDHTVVIQVLAKS